MGNKVYVALLSVALLWTFLLTALVGNVIATNVHGPMGTINFTMFTAALAWLAGLLGLAAAFLPTLARPALLIPAFATVVLFALIDGVVLAAVLRAPDCGALPRAGLPRGWIGYGSRNDETRCRMLEASAAFVWFLWGCFAAVLGLAVREARGGVGSSVLSTRPMSQIV